MISPEILCLLLVFWTLLALFTGFQVVFSLAGSALLFALFASYIGVFDLSFLTAFPQRIFAIMTNELLVAVPLFVFMGVVLEKSKIAESLIVEMARAFRSVRGGIAISVCIVGALLAASTGIVGATVVTMGMLALPTMLEHNNSPALSAGVVAASGTLGQIIPPSIVLIILGDQLSTSYQRAQLDMGNFSPDSVSVNDLFTGAIFPGLVLVSMYILFVLVVAFFSPKTFPAIDGDKLPKASLQGLIGSLVAPLLLIVLVLGSILGGFASPSEAASVGAIGALLLAGHRGASRGARWIVPVAFVALLILVVIGSSINLRIVTQTASLAENTARWAALIFLAVFLLGLLYSVKVLIARNDAPSVLWAAMTETVMVSSMVFAILIGASMFSLVFRGIGGDEIVTEFLTNLPGGVWGALALVMLVIFILGFFIDFFEIVFIVIPIVGPALLQLEIAPGVLMSPIWLGILIALNLQTSFLTPPFGLALFYLRGVAPRSISTSTIFLGVIPFIAMQLLTIGIVIAFPALATWLPDVLLK